LVFWQAREPVLDRDRPLVHSRHVEARDRLSPRRFVDAEVRNGSKQQSHAVAFEVVLVRPAQEPGKTLLHYILGFAPISQQGPGHRRGPAESLREPTYPAGRGANYLTWGGAAGAGWSGPLYGPLPGL